MCKKLLLLSVAAFSFIQSGRHDKPAQEKFGTGQRTAREIGEQTQEIISTLNEAITSNRREFTQDFVKHALPSIEKSSTDLGSKAAVAIAGALTGTAQIAAAVAVASATLHVGEKIADRYYPSEEEKADRAEAAIRTFKAATTLEDLEKVREFGRCLHAHPRMTRDPFGVPGVCTSLSRSLTILGEKEKVITLVAALHSLDTEPICSTSAAQAEAELRASFQVHEENETTKITAKSYFFSLLYKDAILEIPKSSLEPLHKLTALDAPRAACVFEELLKTKYPSMKIDPSEMIPDPVSKAPQGFYIHSSSHGYIHIMAPN